MNVNQSRLLSFLSKAARGEAEMSPRTLDRFAQYARDAMEKQFAPKDEKFTLRMSNIGKPTCQLQMQASGAEPEPPSYDFKMSHYFLNGGSKSKEKGVFFQNFLKNSLKKFIEYQR